MTEKLCECGKPVAGYIGNGIVLTKTCLKCWHKGEDRADHKGRRGIHPKEGKS
jgi:hypothetical protein